MHAAVTTRQQPAAAPAAHHGPDEHVRGLCSPASQSTISACGGAHQDWSGGEEQQGSGIGGDGSGAVMESGGEDIDEEEDEKIVILE